MIMRSTNMNIDVEKNTHGQYSIIAKRLVIENVNKSHPCYFPTFFWLGCTETYV